MKKQWWITGFNPNFTEPNPYDMVLLGSVDFSSRPDFYISFKNAINKQKKLSKFIICDDNSKKVWIIW